MGNELDRYQSSCSRHARSYRAAAAFFVASWNAHSLTHIFRCVRMSCKRCKWSHWRCPILTGIYSPGYIAGVTNPIFESKDWWDLLCNIETGKMTVHKDIHTTPPSLSSFPVPPTNPLPRLPGQDTPAATEDDPQSRPPTSASGFAVKADNGPRPDHPDNLFMEEVLWSPFARTSLTNFA